MPRADDLPAFTVDMTVTRAPSNPLGIKGCGEAGAIAAPAAVINAITDAIGTEELTMPATAQTVWSALQRSTTAARRPRRDEMYEFKFHRPTTVRQAAGLLARQEEAKLLAGGHTLIPTMKLRLAGPKHIIDMSQIEGLTGIEMKGRSLVIGARTPHVEVATSPIVKENIPALAELACRDRRSGGAPSRHHRRLDRQQRSECRLSGGGAWARRHRDHQQAPYCGGRFLQGPVRDRARARRDHRAGAVPEAEQGGLCEIPQSRPRALRWSACSRPSAAPTSAWR